MEDRPKEIKIKTKVIREKTKCKRGFKAISKVRSLEIQKGKF